MITDPSETGKMEWLDTCPVIRGESLYDEVHPLWMMRFDSSKRGLCARHDGGVGVRIVMNVMDMKKLMEQNK